MSLLYFLGTILFIGEVTTIKTGKAMLEAKRIWGISKDNLLSYLDGCTRGKNEKETKLPF